MRHSKARTTGTVICNNFVISEEEKRESTATSQAYVLNLFSCLKNDWVEIIRLKYTSEVTRIHYVTAVHLVM